MARWQTREPWGVCPLEGRDARDDSRQGPRGGAGKEPGAGRLFIRRGRLAAG